MSTQEEASLNRKLKQLIPLMWAILAGAFGVGGWVASLEWRMRDNDKTKAAVSEIQLWKASTDGNRFTSQEGHSLANGLSEKIVFNDKRIQRTEDAIIVVKEALGRIEKKLDAQ